MGSSTTPSACLAPQLPWQPPQDLWHHVPPLSSAYKKYVRETYNKQTKSQET